LVCAESRRFRRGAHVKAQIARQGEMWSGVNVAAAFVV